MNEVTQILDAIARGDRQAANQLLPAVYQELRQLAAKKLKHEAPGQTLEATALVHEAYLRLVGNEDQPRWENRAHFFAAAAEAMRRILVDQARRKQSLKRGGAMERNAMDDVPIATHAPPEEIITLHEALDQFSQDEPKKAELVKLRYFVGMTIEEAAEVLGISRATASNYWQYARAWLFSAVKGREQST